MCRKDIDPILKKMETAHDAETLRDLLRKAEGCHTCISQTPDDGRQSDCLCILCFQMEIKNSISHILNKGHNIGQRKG